MGQMEQFLLMLLKQLSNAQCWNIYLLLLLKKSTLRELSRNFVAQTFSLNIYFVIILRKRKLTTVMSNSEFGLKDRNRNILFWCILRILQFSYRQSKIQTYSIRNLPISTVFKR